MWNVQFTDERGISSLAKYPFVYRSDAYNFLMREYADIRFLYGDDEALSYMYECSNKDTRGAYVLVYKER